MKIHSSHTLKNNENKRHRVLYKIKRVCDTKLSNNQYALLRSAIEKADSL